MLRQAIMETREQVGELAPTASLEFWAAHREEARLDRFDAWIDALSAQEFRIEGTTLEALVAPVLAGLGREMEADRVLFYTPADSAGLEAGCRDSRLSPMALWRPGDEGPEGVEAEAELSLAGLEEGGRGLWNGEALRLSDLEPSARRRERVRFGGGWAPVRARLLVPCLLNDRLLGVFGIEGTLGAARWSTATLTRANFVGRMFAGVLDRARLTREVEALRAQQARTDRLAVVGQIASGVAHDFNNVLTAILGYSDLLEMEWSDPERSGDTPVELDEIRDAAARATGLVDQVLSFGRARPRRVERLDLSRTLRGLEGMLRRVAGNAVSVELDLADDAPAGLEAGTNALPAAPSAIVELEPERFERVVLNLAANARDAMAEGVADPRFLLSTRIVRIDPAAAGSSPQGSPVDPDHDLPPGPYVRLTARDYGCGIDPAHIERIFEPFFTTKEDSGTGLGLANSADFVRAAGGDIRVESTTGEGTAFHLYFPLAFPLAGPADAA